jgi:threonine dehydratase
VQQALRTIPLMIYDYLKRILNAKVYEVAIETPLELAQQLSERVGNQVLLKREDLQPVFSFKLRGAYNKMANLAPEQLARGVIAASAGNHAQGVALAAQKLGCKATIVMPVTTPGVKIDAVAARGAQVVLFGDSYNDAYQHALALQEQSNFSFVHPFDDPDVIAGQGTIGMEILRQHPGKLKAVFVAIGGGGLISGIAAYIKALRPDVLVIGVQTNDSDAMVQSIEQGQRVTLKDVGLFSDGTAVKVVGEETFRLCQQHVDGWVRVNTDQICAAIKDVFQDTRSILEPAGALAIAGMKQYCDEQGWRDETVVAVACGANMNFDRLRFVAERAEVGEQREAVFAVTIPERPGSFRAFCALVGERNVTEFNYRISGHNQAHVFVGLQVAGLKQAASAAQAFQQAGFDTLDLTNDELAKLHLRHLVGGRSALAEGERLMRFEFPERPGALMRFLAHLPQQVNISLFHYRNHGADYGRILVGLQVPAAVEPAFDTFLLALGYPYTDESQHPAYRLFLG